MGYESNDLLSDDPQPGPSWARADWRSAGDDLTEALDPTAMQVAIKAAAAKAGAALDSRAVEEAAADSIRAMMLVRTYRVRGHLGADLDPLGLSHQNLPADLDPAYHGFSGEALDRKVYLGGTLGLEWSTLRELVDILKRNYCGKVEIGRAHV